ncbi:hypothetical protein B0H13DRAFT_1924007 [Mycena leptocephala]|nr:hypothetical protein B0H13DRAFT_1924007 [Mycena leptocephala]
MRERVFGVGATLRRNEARRTARGGTRGRRSRRLRQVGVGERREHIDASLEGQSECGRRISSNWSWVQHTRRIEMSMRSGQNPGLKSRDTTHLVRVLHSSTARSVDTLLARRLSMQRTKRGWRRRFLQHLAGGGQGMDAHGSVEIQIQTASTEAVGGVGGARIGNKASGRYDAAQHMAQTKEGVAWVWQTARDQGSAAGINLRSGQD